MSMHTRLFFLVLIFCEIFTSLEGCGITTHMLISNRARDYFTGKGESVHYHQLLHEHNDAFLAGSAFPDAFYSNLCSNGSYHQVSEDTHWTPFLNVSITYIRNTYPQPWDKSTQKLVVFLFGIMSHQVADVVWHSLGIDQGFISTLAAVDFHGKYDTAHEVADLGGDVVSIFDMDVHHDLDPEDDWYVPTEDLFNIYKEYYGSVKIDTDTIDTCSTLLMLASIAEIYGLPELYQVVAETSPFLQNRMEDYFLGGVNDMAGWSNRIWENGVTLLENGVGACTLPHNPLFIQCNKSPAIGRASSRSKNGYFVQPNLHGLTTDDVVITKKYRGISIRPSAAVKELKQSLRKQRKPVKNDFLPKKAGVYAVNSSYAKLGWSMATGDMDKDGFEDFVVGAPGYNVKGSPQEGRVYIIYGNDSESSGFEYYDRNLDLDFHWTPLHTTTLHGYSKKQSRFGSGVAVLDINLDGVLDLAVGSPAYYIDSPLEYKGLVSVYLGKQNNRKYDKPDLVFTCQSVYCNLGYTLEAGDIDGDGNEDLIMGLPFYTGMYNQSGVVAAYMSSKEIPVGPGKTIAIEDVKWKQHPDKPQPYAWFGFSIAVKNQTLRVTSPNNRKCADPSCAFSPQDIQETGRADIFNYGQVSMIKNQTILGTIEQEAAGYSLDFGYLYDTQTLILAVGYPGMTVMGSYWTVPLNLTRAGMVILYNMTSTPTEIARFEGNRRYGGFGSLVKIMDVNGDGTDDLLIGEPTRNANKLEIINDDDGLVYVFYGGSKFPKGDPTMSSKCSLTKPCPEKIADFVSKNYDYLGVNNGHDAKLIKTIKSGMIMFTSDIRYPYSEVVLYAGRRTGGIHHYYINREKNKNQSVKT